jgi:hypothetical protein
MEKLRFSAGCTAVLGFISVIAQVFLFLALADIAHQEQDLSPEWHIAGICMIILSLFTISTFVTLGFLLKYSDRFNLFENN